MDEEGGRKGGRRRKADPDRIYHTARISCAVVSSLTNTQTASLSLFDFLIAGVELQTRKQWNRLAHSALFAAKENMSIDSIPAGQVKLREKWMLEGQIYNVIYNNLQKQHQFAMIVFCSAVLSIASFFCEKCVSSK